MAKRTNIMLCQPFEERRLQKWNVPEVIVQPKLDGERARAYWDHEREGWVLMSSEGNEFKHVPHINAELLELNIPKSFHLDGELYIHNSTFNEIHSIASRKVNRHHDADAIEYHVFDLITHAPMGQRTSMLWEALDFGSCIKLVPTHTCDPTAEAILDHMQSYVTWGYEGIIVRHPGAFYEVRRSPYIMKFKPGKTDIYPICGYSIEVSIEGVEKDSSVGRLIACSVDDPLPWLGEYPAKKKLPAGYFGIGSGTGEDNIEGFSRIGRRDLWSQRDTLQGKFVEVYYQALTPAHVPRFPVFKALMRGE